ncbi:hypothetical protein MLD38_028256 [Melastoma candidum]|uniref:Uncharacterized protein n=2 Tax=Melastoma candidum TaxID=119954 RepID=A0ACB9N1T5_9MYRT|nr:hypothetical protein MLD38_028256 [Melastoma candidum]
MGEPLGILTTSVADLTDDLLVLIFRRLCHSSDRESFGLTCRRWLHIENTCRRSLQFDCSFSIPDLSLFHRSLSVKSFHLRRLLSRFKHLESLSLSGCTELPDSGLAHLSSCGSSLRSLYLECCLGITDNGIFSVAAGCPSLTVINLYRCSISDAGLEALANGCLGLRDVNLAYCSLITDHGLQALTERCRSLRAVKISYCRNISGTGFSGCSPTLAYVDAESCKIDPSGMVGIVSGGGLEYLNLSGVGWWLNSVAAIGMGHAEKLKILNLRLCRSIGDESVLAIAKGCPLLREWNLALCMEVKISGWESVGKFCNNLKILHVNRCRNLCDRGLRALSEGCRKLKILYIGRNSRVSSLGLELFKMRRGDVKLKEEEVVCIGPDWTDNKM